MYQNRYSMTKFWCNLCPKINACKYSLLALTEAHVIIEPNHSAGSARPMPGRKVDFLMFFFVTQCTKGAGIWTARFLKGDRSARVFLSKRVASAKRCRVHRADSASLPHRCIVTRELWTLCTLHFCSGLYCGSFISATNTVFGIKITVLTMHQHGSIRASRLYARSWMHRAHQMHQYSCRCLPKGWQGEGYFIVCLKGKSAIQKGSAKVQQELQA